MKSLTLHKSDAITLAELMIAMVIVGIIMLGVVSSDYAIQRFYKDSSTGTVSGFNAIAMMNYISAVALKAQGTKVDPGIMVDSSILDPAAPNGTGYTIGDRTFCIRTVQNPNSWQCFSAIGGVGTTALYYCTKLSPAVCVNTDTKLASLTRMLGKFVLVTTAGSQRLLFTYTLFVPDTDTTNKTYVTSITPPNHRL